MIFLLVIFIVSALTVATVDMSEDSYITKTYVDQLVKSQEIRLLEKTVSTVIEDIFKKDDLNIDSLDENWAKPYFLPTKIGDISVNIVDQERFLNPNSLVDDKGVVVDSVYARFLRLFDYLNISKDVLDNIVDWIDNRSDSNSTSTIPIKNAPIKSLDELRYVEGVDDRVFLGDIDSGGYVAGFRTFFSPFSNGKVNINTASKYALIGLDEKIDESLAEKIIEKRGEKAFKSVDDLINVNGVTIDTIFRLRNVADVKSSNFLILIKIENNGNISKLSLLYKREGAVMKKIWRKIE